MSLKHKLSLPSPKWLLLGLIILAVIGIAKLIMWITPIMIATSVKIIMWITPIAWSIITWLFINAWQMVIWVSAGVCVYVVFEWRMKKQRQLYRDVADGILIDVEYSVDLVE